MTPKIQTRLLKNYGFTLVELLIVVAIIAILGAIAVPAYNGYVTNSKQGSARAVLEQIPVLIETYRAENGRMCPNCTPTANGGPFVYGYSEDTSGNENYGGNKIVSAYRDFKPKGSGTNLSLYDYTISFTTTGCPANCKESATATAIPATPDTPAGNIVGNPYQ